MKKIMAVYDNDPAYAERLSDYVNRKEKGLFEAQAFTSKEKLDEYAKKHRIDVLLTGAGPGGSGPEAVPAGRTIYLTEEQTAKTAAGHTVCKYQSGDDIIREVMAVYSETLPPEEVLPGLSVKGKRVVGVYSPVNRCGKTSLALAIGQVFAKEEKVLFITLDSFTGFTGLLDERWKRDLSDLIYYHRQGRFNALRLNSLVYYFGEMAWLPPLRFPEDLNQVSAGEMAALIAKILEESDYETIVLDVGAYGRQVIPFLELCQVVYMPVREDIFSRAKLDEFDAYINDSGKRPLKEKFFRVHVPMVTGIKRVEHFPQELLWGDMGDFVRNLLKGRRDLWES